MNQENLAPVTLFVYARPVHTQRTIEALLKNPEAKFTDLIVYSDGARNNTDISTVNQVREIIKKTSGFKSIKLIEREQNFGLAKNIISGVTEVTEEYGRVIVLEDDILTSPLFLNFMNSALEKYKNSKRIWHISGWNYPLKDIDTFSDVFFWRVMNCWGWATWKDRWSFFEKKPQMLKDTWEIDTISRFNLDGTHDFFSQIENNMNGSLNTWAIFWYATIFSNHGLCLNPTSSFVYNIGNDGSGENCGHRDIYKNILNQKKIRDWPTIIEEDINIVTAIKNFYISHRPKLVRRILSKIKRVFL
ncbi:glycosyltransferase [Providencia rettgeri]|uniref:glycosyltransferase n=1 Tax=Providencia rettgeri TaxID=587 RepID=UPI001BAD730C|nr:glycosyltransferase [Providencia rettgeri]MBS0874964.1 glycosyltransferase [Providencia rettgeri]MBS0921896.1 glycosyltransferase [Providencia rettgeri]